MVVLARDDRIVEVFIVPPETAAHADGIPEKLRSCVHGITTDQASMAAPSNCIAILVLNSIREPLLTYDWLQLFLDKIEICITFSPHHIK